MITTVKAGTEDEKHPVGQIIDNDVNTFYQSGTAKARQKVELFFNPTQVDKVVLVNRLGADGCDKSCLDRLTNTVISLWKDGSKVRDCGTIKHVNKEPNEGNQTYVEYCGGKVGNMIEISQNENLLHFAEIRIYKLVDKDRSQYQ